MKIKYGHNEWDTYVTVNDVELDVCVHYYTSPAEPDVNWGGGVDITGIFFEDEGDITAKVSESEIESLYQRVEEHENARWEDPRY